MIDNNEKLILAVSNIAIQAGNIIMEYYMKDPEVMIKQDAHAQFALLKVMAPCVSVGRWRGLAAAPARMLALVR